MRPMHSPTSEESLRNPPHQAACAIATPTCNPQEEEVEKYYPENMEGMTPHWIRITGHQYDDLRRHPGEDGGRLQMYRMTGGGKRWKTWRSS